MTSGSGMRKCVCAGVHRVVRTVSLSMFITEYWISFLLVLTLFAAVLELWMLPVAWKSYFESTFGIQGKARFQDTTVTELDNIVWIAFYGCSYFRPSWGVSCTGLEKDAEQIRNYILQSLENCVVVHTGAQFSSSVRHPQIVDFKFMYGFIVVPRAVLHWDLRFVFLFILDWIYECIVRCGRARVGVSEAQGGIQGGKSPSGEGFEGTFS